MSDYLLEHALIGETVHRDVHVVTQSGRFTVVEPGASDVGAAVTRVPGLAVPGLANTHSHAFHRALRGRAQRGTGDFWTWREQMYGVAGRLEPDTYVDLARAVYREMAAAGVTAVGEFHYVHHRPDGRPYAPPHAMAEALAAAARDAGVRLTLLDTCYLAGGLDASGPVPLAGVQRRYDDGSVERWSDRVAALRQASLPGAAEGTLRVGVAAHSVRAVPADALPRVAEAAADGPLHIHLSEQPAENEACLRAHGVTPTELLARHGFLGPRTSVVHATHLTSADIALLGEARVFASFCPTTERDLADGIGPATELVGAGVRLTLGSDSHAVIDPFEEMRAIEMHTRLSTGRRGTWRTGDLVTAATVDGHASLGFDDAGVIEVGRRADLVVLDLGSPRTAGAGADENTAVYAATAADVVMTVADGEIIFRRDDRDAIGAELAGAIAALVEKEDA